jgi:hypothetical protein
MLLKVFHKVIIRVGELGMIWQVAGPLMERRLGLLQLGYLGDLAWQVLRKGSSPVLLKGKTEGGKQAIA